MEYYSVIRNNQVMLFTTWIELEMIIVSEERERQIPYNVTYMWNLKYDTNEPTYETETKSET